VRRVESEGGKKEGERREEEGRKGGV